MSKSQTLIILGTGWGSYSVLKSINKKLYKVIVVSPRNHFLFTPLLCSTTVGTLEFRSIIEPIRNAGFRQSEDFHLAYATQWGIGNQKIKCESVLLESNKFYDLHYDKLVIGVGALSNTFGVKGVREHAFFLKEVADARKIRNRLLTNFELSLEPSCTVEERKRLLHTVIVGGGPTGVEFGAELYDFVRQDVARLYNLTQVDVRVTLVESHKILGAFDARLQSYAEKKITERKNFNLVKSTVTEVQADGVTLKDGTRLSCGLVVWSTGLAPRKFTEDLSVQKNKQGQIMVDKYLRIISDPSGNSYSIGDCANIVDYPLPCTAQVAERQGRYVADLLNKQASSIPKLDQDIPFSFQSMGMLAYIGDYKALTDTKEFKIKGVSSWLLWRSAYLTRLGSWRLRMQVPLDWLKTLIFGRDTSRLE